VWKHEKEHGQIHITSSTPQDPTNPSAIHLNSQFTSCIPKMLIEINQFEHHTNSYFPGSYQPSPIQCNSSPPLRFSFLE